MVKKGVGERQIKDARTSQQVILNVLSDNEWHRYQDIQKQSGLSTATLSKHLRKLGEGLVEKKLDLESEEYPYPVYYRIRTIEITPEAEEYRTLLQSSLKDRAQRHIELGKLVDYIRYLNAEMNSEVISNLQNYFYLGQNEEWFEQATEYFVISVYRQAIKEFKEKLKQLATKGEDIKKLLSTTQWQLAEEFVKTHTENISPKLRKHTLKLIEEIKRKQKSVEP